MSVCSGDDSSNCRCLSLENNNYYGFISNRLPQCFPGRKCGSDYLIPRTFRVLGNDQFRICTKFSLLFYLCIVNHMIIIDLKFEVGGSILSKQVRLANR